MIGLALGEGVELDARVLQQILAADEVAAFRGFVEQEPAEFVIGGILQFIRRIGLFADFFEVFRCEIVIPARPQALHECGGRARVFVAVCGPRPSDQNTRQRTTARDPQPTITAHDELPPRNSSRFVSHLRLRAGMHPLTLREANRVVKRPETRENHRRGSVTPQSAEDTKPIDVVGCPVDLPNVIGLMDLN